ncbi:major facilitator superfamily domain-containing protein [Phascolomyces articulosus]|uniref:Major facilitator superfamily domain-containing protein n=1 Tax=Phascolomyces articulosus TaxID=60185 RepID=A0AAD5PDB5_9FUNG|nr:major facilitator superfamily domain-containing protein [Phascolomyces articulosus]
MQDFFEQTTFDNIPNAALQLSFVGTLCGAFANFMAPVAQILRSMLGTRMVLLLGTFLMALGLAMAGFTSQVWHLYLTQSLCYGTGVSFLYSMTIIVAPQWFSNKRGVALGCITSGAGIGGIIVPLIMNAINDALGAAWTYRILCFISLACNFMGCIFIKDRIPLPRARKRLSEIIGLDVFKNRSYSIWCLGGVLQMMAYYVPYFFVPSYATYLGLSAPQGASLVSISFAFNFIGRICAGILADRIGPINTNIIFTIISSLANFIIWTLAKNYGALIVFMVFIGFTSGCYLSLVSPITASILSGPKFPMGLAIVVLLNGTAVFSTSISSAIESRIGAEPFLTYKMFAGVAYILGTFVMIWLKFSINRKVLAKL